MKRRTKKLWEAIDRVGWLVGGRLAAPTVNDLPALTKFVLAYLQQWGGSECGLCGKSFPETDHRAECPLAQLARDLGLDRGDSQ